MDPVSGSRTSIVERINIYHTKKGETFHPNFAGLGLAEADEVWSVWVSYRTGLLPTSFSTRVFLTESEANAFAEKYPVGSEYVASSEFVATHPDDGRKLIESIIDEFPFGPGPLSAGDADLFLTLDVLHKSGLRTKELAKDFLGTERINQLKRTIGENWAIAAQLEYCWLTLPHTSPAYIATLCRYHYFVTGDDFSAGYLLRDLECLMLGAEAEATKTLAMRKKAGAEGSKKSAQAREQRRIELMDAIDLVNERNPDVVKLGPIAVSSLALTICLEKAPALWSQGKGQVQEYLGEIRRGEAGEVLKARYDALFPSKPPKRSDSRA